MTPYLETLFVLSIVITASFWLLPRKIAMRVTGASLVIALVALWSTGAGGPTLETSEAERLQERSAEFVEVSEPSLQEQWESKVEKNKEDGEAMKRKWENQQ